MNLWLLLVVLAQDKADEARLYGYQMQQHQAQLIVLREQNLIDAGLARQLARAIPEADAETRRDVVPLREDYAAFERRLVAKVGERASLLHLGRSNNDMGATSERLFLRDDLLELLARQVRVRRTLLALAREHVDTVMPGYTHMVQAQPTTLAHQLSAFAAAMERDAERWREVYARVDASPLGVGAFTTSGYGLNRERLRELMGLTGLVENGYDAVMVGTVDTKVEYAQALGLAALQVGRLMQQFLIQYSDTRPGITLADGASGHSSIMPQKRNPSDGERVRVLASSIVADAHAVALMAHNTPGGEHKDIRFELLERAERVSRQMGVMLEKLEGFVRTWRVNRERLRELGEGDDAVMTELADTLEREGRVAFRVGHQVAAALTKYGREQGKRPLELSYGEFEKVYREVTGKAAPVGEAEFRRAMSAEAFVRGRKGRGGPQPEEMRRMLGEQERKLEELERWLGERRAGIAAATARREEAFRALGR